MRTTSPANASGKPVAIENALGLPCAAKTTAGSASSAPRLPKTKASKSDLSGVRSFTWSPLRARARIVVDGAQRGSEREARRPAGRLAQLRRVADADRNVRRAHSL